MMLLSLIKKEFKLLLNDIHGLAVLFLMPAVFLLIMSLAIPDNREGKSGFFSVAINSTPLVNSDDIEFFRYLLQKNESIHTVTVSDTVEEIIDVTHAYLELDESTESYLSGEGESHFEIGLRVSPKLDVYLLAQIKGIVLNAAAHTRLKNSLIDNGLISDSDNFDDLVNAITEISPQIQIVELNTDTGKLPNATEQSMPAWMIFGMFFIVMPLANTLIKERKNNTLARMKSFSVSANLILLHKLIPYAIVNQFQFIFFLFTGLIIVPLMGGDTVKLNNSFVFYLLIALATSVAALGLGLLIAILCRTTEQAMVLGGGLNLILAAIGGIMIPEHIMSDTIQVFAGYSPMNWALNGFQSILLFDLNVQEFNVYVAKLILFGVIAFFIALLIFKHQYRKLMWS